MADASEELELPLPEPVLLVGLLESVLLEGELEPVLLEGELKSMEEYTSILCSPRALILNSGMRTRITTSLFSKLFSAKTLAGLIATASWNSPPSGRWVISTH